jgi:3-deoxy-D-manno-octulosonic-acid transferase
VLRRGQGLTGSPPRGSRVLLRLLGFAIDLGYLAAAPILLPLILLASRCFTRPKYRRGLARKLGAARGRTGSGPSLWVHAVSVGEVITAVPFVKALAERYPAWEVRVSVSTFTGFEVAARHFGDDAVFYFPLDLSPSVGRLFRLERPAAVILLELELWPNFLLAARRRGVPVLVANGRITERSARRYAMGGWLTRRLFGLVTSFGAQNEEYRQRFVRLGVEPGRIEVLGNLKHDRGPSVSSGEAAAARRNLGWPEGETLILVGGSTHPGEEAILCDIHRGLREKDPRMRLVLAPRHVERLSEAEPERWGAGGPIVRWSSVRGAPGGRLSGPEAPILLVDTVGDLERFYAMADLVFVGGSLVPHGGHNLFEPARLGKAILFGPSIHNFAEEAELLVGEGAAVRVEDAGGLRAGVGRLAASPEDRLRLGSRALEVTRLRRGAVERHIEWVERRLHAACPL